MKNYDTLFFDLDGTLAESKRAINAEMAETLSHASQSLRIVIITGGILKQIRTQVIDNLLKDAQLENVYIMPTSGSSMYRYNKVNQVWDMVYEHVLTQKQKDLIISSLRHTLDNQVSFTISPDELIGEQIEDRETQITLSALGQQQPIEVKQNWDPDQRKRRELVGFLNHLKDDFDIKIGGTTSVDITLKGIDKAFGINEFYKHTGFDINKGLFIGDQIIPGGNDYAATKTVIETYNTSGPEETMTLINRILEDGIKDVVS
ncbi:MAG: HAD-IIB family hydrolase [Candidatus Pacebacteria bacterium]|nr:HAD-IIB family hydrolase [Candidatus Paceibacterota bacterium]